MRTALRDDASSGGAMDTFSNAVLKNSTRRNNLAVFDFIHICTLSVVENWENTKQSKTMSNNQVTTSFGKHLGAAMEGGVAERQATPGLSGEFNGAGSHFSISELARFGAANGDCGWTQEPHPPIFTWIPTELNYPERPTFSSLFGLGFDFSSVDQWVHSNLNGDPDRLGGITSQGDSGEAKVLAHNPSSGIPPSMGSAAIQGIKRKLAASLSGAADRLRLVDIRAIFEAFHANRQPPPHSEFQIVLGVDNGNNISPPSFEFEDGLYILMKPQQKNRVRCKIPSNLLDYVITDTPAVDCPWIVSGPQFAKPTVLQKRYCYPKGDAGYSSRKGGTVWTMYGPDGKEDLACRLLHVYFSVKRATTRHTNHAKHKRKVPVV